MTNLSAENLRWFVVNEGKEMAEDKVWGDLHSDWAQDFDTDQLRALLLKFGSFVESSHYVQKNYIILDSAQFWAQVDDEDHELAAALADDDFDVDVIDGYLVFTPEDQYLYLGATESEAWEFLVEQGLAKEEDRPSA